MNRDIVVGIVAALRAERSGIQFAAQADFHFLQSVQTGYGAHPTACSVCTGGSSPRIKRRGREVTTNLHLVLKLTIRSGTALRYSDLLYFIILNHLVIPI
jgi:hypothetical protein